MISVIRKLPMQYHTYLEEVGNGLCGGEKQRIALARAFLKTNEFYILDESTSNQDFDHCPQTGDGKERNCWKERESITGSGKCSRGTLW